MFEKLDKLRAEVKRIAQKVEDDKARLKAAEMKLKEAENTQIIADVGALNLTPEQLSTFLAEYALGKIQLEERSKPTESIMSDFQDEEEEEKLYEFE